MHLRASGGDLGGCVDEGVLKGVGVGVFKGCIKGGCI